MAEMVGCDPGSTQGAAQAFQFSTDRYPARERVAAWSEALGRHCGVCIDLDPRSAGDFRSSAQIARSSTFGLIEGAMSPARQRSSRSLVTNDDITFASVMTSRWGVSQLGRDLNLQASGIVGDVGAEVENHLMHGCSLRELDRQI